ncbi:hypothetical protein B7767_20485 [Streptomyces sp. 13-12-16]|uniref:DUF6257 family protein n=1 Tax=Streptomyces sp. 13-12-16 TaxID=1570823 RepID=UPI000A1FDAEB|nr:DUF6257 family protein [Streptomyces sp. 13-12-16]OSP41521.1 hypothetical protein B7767_20485 [Streptomyces sp. 13-12-16]
MPDGLNLSDLTAGEKLRMAGLIARMAKRGLADDGTGNVDLSDLKRRFERIENQARRRKNGGK